MMSTNASVSNCMKLDSASLELFGIARVFKENVRSTLFLLRLVNVRARFWIFRHLQLTRWTLMLLAIFWYEVDSVYVALTVIHQVTASDDESIHLYNATNGRYHRIDMVLKVFANNISTQIVSRKLFFASATESVTFVLHTTHRQLYVRPKIALGTVSWLIFRCSK